MPLYLCTLCVWALCVVVQDSDDDELSDELTTIGELSDDSDSDDSDTESLASSVAELSSGLLEYCVHIIPLYI